MGKTGAADQHYLLTICVDSYDETRRFEVILLPAKMPLAFAFPITSRKQLAELEPGQQVTVEGVCEGRSEEMREAIQFTACKLVKIK